jgi:ABC-type lipoprotein release transport system permease subunit
VGAFDPLTFVSVSALMLAVVVVATMAPAWRAAHADPAHALRQE